MLTSSGYQQMDMCSNRPRTAKHLTERKRRARINDSLLQLKSMVFPVIKKDISRHPKMEKADILEMTVRYLKDVQTPEQGESKGQVTTYHAGFTECLSEVSTFMSNCESIDIETRLRLLGHLADRCSTINDADQKPDVSRLQPAQTQQQQQRVPSPVTVPQQQTRVAAPSPISIPATSPVQQFATTPNGMVLLLPAHTVQHNSVISVRVPLSSDGVLTPPQSPMSPEPTMTRFTPSPVDIKPSKTALNTKHHRFAPYQKHAIKASEKSMWRPW
ncbi:transcription factor HES-4 [Strongylocentrotus purpuratus]|uniref:Hairy and enhancer of split transcription factor C n=1 Tax=Strongylocentrotus purpuratus TaxID=7668 RepID=A0A7M7RIK0_STRPU|nr:transcription factor HES-4 [Strongylocentrotus purpuratus]